METYPCPACGGAANQTEGCRSCGRAPDPAAAGLAKVERDLADLDAQARRLAADEVQLRQQRTRLLAQRAALTNTIARRLAEEAAPQQPGRKVPKARGRPGTRTPGDPTRPEPDAPGGPAVGPDASAARASAVGGPHEPETSTRSVQNTLLTLGGILLGITAIVFTGVAYSSAATGGRAFILGLTTTGALGVPVLLARRRLTATAETIAAVGLLLVLLDGYAAYSVNLAGVTGLDPPSYAAVLLALVAAVAAAYRLATHLVAPQFAALLAVQPLIPLLGVQAHLGRAGFAAVFALVAAVNVGAAALLTRPAGTAYTTIPPLLRELAWSLFGLALAGAAVAGTTELALSSTVAGVVRASSALLLAAAVGVFASQLTDRGILRHLATGSAALAIIVSMTRMNLLVWPEYTLILTAALAAVIALAAGLLPEPVRLGPRLASLIATGVIVVAISYNTIRAGYVTVHASLPLWHAHLDRYASLVDVVSWQVPVAALLLTVGAGFAAPVAWRVDALVLGGSLIAVALPGTGALAWWTVPLLAVTAATAATVLALTAGSARSALLRAGSGILLGLYAAATGLARPELTTATFTAIALLSAASAMIGAGWPHLGQYVDRVADMAGGGATLAIPVAVGSFAYLLGAGPGVLLPITLLGAAVSLTIGAISQVAGRVPRTLTAGGALAAAAGCVLLSLRIDATAVDLLLALLLLASAAVSTASRAFEVPAGAVTPPRTSRPLGGGFIDAIKSGPGAVAALAEAIEGDDTPPTWAARPGSGPEVRLDAVTIGAAGATAALACALARMVAVSLPGLGIVTTTAMVFVTALGVRALPPSWRLGPQLGGVAVSSAIGVVAAAVASAEAVAVLAAVTPWWHADLAAWPRVVTAWAPYGWQVPVTLALAAAAAWALLPAPRGGDVAFLTLAMAGLAAPAALGLAWWSPVLIASVLAGTAGLIAACTTPRPAVAPPVDPPDTATPPDEPVLVQEEIRLQEDLAHQKAAEESRRLARNRIAAVAALGLYAVAAAMARPDATGLALGGVVVAGALVATVARRRATAPDLVYGLALAAALLAAPGAAACGAVAAGLGRTGVLAWAMAVAAAGVPVLVVLRRESPGRLIYPVGGVAAGAFIVALAALPDFSLLTPYAGVATIIAAAASATLRPSRAAAVRAMIFAAGPPAAVAVLASAPAWVIALFGPYRTAEHVWSGYAATPVPSNPGPASLTLALLALAGGGAAAALGGARFILPAALPPMAALALVLPAATGAARPVTPWAALATALAAGLGAALTRPAVPAATRLLRTTAGVICALTGAAGLAGSLASRASTLGALSVILLAAVLAAVAGRDPAVRVVAWMVSSSVAFALPVTAFAAAGRSVRPAAFGVLVACGVLVATAWLLARPEPGTARAGEATVVELCAYFGAAFAVLLTLGSARYAAGVLTVCGILLGAAALRRDRSALSRTWLVRAAAATELGACWLLLYSVAVGLPEAYTLPFALVALLAGVLELRRRPDLSSWAAYGPALAGGFLPSMALVLIGDGSVWRRAILFTAAVLTVITGSWRRRRAPVVVGAAVAVLIPLRELAVLWLNGVVAWYYLFGAAGLVLVAIGATYERRRRDLVRLRDNLRQMS